MRLGESVRDAGAEDEGGRLAPIRGGQVRHGHARQLRFGPLGGIVVPGPDLGPRCGEGARSLGALTIPGGGVDTLRRLEVIREQRATVLLCTPSYALRMLEQARDLGLDMRYTDVRVTIHAGEPGASIPSVRAQIEAGWGARCYDHAGATEIGAFGYPCEMQTDLHISEAEFIAEIFDPASGRAVGAGQEGELVLTNLGRAGWPVIHYRTGDRVRHGGYGCACSRTTLLLPGGILGRADAMLIVLGLRCRCIVLQSTTPDPQLAIPTLKAH